MLLDAGTKKLCRHNQYFGVRAAQDAVRRREGGIIWHTQGSGKSLIMVWLAKWERENREGARGLMITDCPALDEPSEKGVRGGIQVFVDECHRTQSGDLHKAMKALLPNAIFIGFTGTPLLKADKQKSIEVFGRYIHTYKFDQAVREGVVLDLRYEARDIDQKLTNKDKIDQWFEAKTKGLNDLARAQLKQKWGTMQRVLSSQDRLEENVGAILMDM